MNRFLTYINLFERLAYEAEGGGSGSAPAAAAAPSDPAASAPPSDAATPAPAAAAEPPAGDTPAPAGGDIYRPQGLPDHLLGKSNNETIDNVAKALAGYRERDAANHVPETAEAYGEFSGDIPEAIKPHLDTLREDPLSARMQQFALDNRISLPAYQGLVKQFLSVSAEMGLMDPIVDAEAERTALVPDAAKHLPAGEQKKAVETRMNENYAFLDLLAQRGTDQGGLAKDDIEFAKAMLGDSAKGHRVIEWMKTASAGGQGGGPTMQAGGHAAADDPRKELQRRAALPQNTWGHKDFDRASYDQLQADYKKQLGG